MLVVLNNTCNAWEERTYEYQGEKVIIELTDYVKTKNAKRQENREKIFNE